MRKYQAIDKQSFSFLELILAIVLIGIIITQFIPKNNSSKLNIATNKMVLYLKYTRYMAMIDNKFDHKNNKWYKAWWTLKFHRCNKSIGGIYYVVYSDISGGTAHYKKEDCLKDPLTNKYLYSNGCTRDTLNDKSKYILLSEFGVTKVDVSCNTTSAIGQISFAHDGKIYSQLGGTPIKDYEITKTCYINMYDENNNKATIAVEANTGFIYKV
ncbi:N-terminal methylation [hydrothermal vent metagenome]|uniref:N-terminal methylation n=1 Tax=hydrothermal vent metagenome TaxID=652676 RepID=A0A3B1DT45_9ZZZZ